MNKTVVIDASLAAKWVLPEDYSDQALALAGQWAEEDTRLIAPCLMLTEVTNALYKRIVRGEMDLATGIAALNTVLEFDIEILEEPGLHSRSMELSHQLERPATYDCHYLALAELHHCELWTGDERFYNSVKQNMPQVKWIGGYVSPSMGSQAFDDIQ